MTTKKVNNVRISVSHNAYKAKHTRTGNHHLTTNKTNKFHN